MLWRQAICAAMAVAYVWATPGASVAATTLSTASVCLGFGSTYTAPDGASCTHRGLDLVLGGGETVRAPAEGTVRFAGRVPGPHGGSVLAITLDTAHGTVSLLPLAYLRAHKGDQVRVGDDLGALAESGDPSSAGSHVHMGLRRGDLYVDPVVLLQAAAPAPSPEAQPEPQPQPGAAPQTAAPSHAADGRPAPSAAAPAPAPLPSAAGVAAVPGVAAVIGAAAAPGASAAARAPAAMPEGVSLAPAPGTPISVAIARTPVEPVGWTETAVASTPGMRLLALAENALRAVSGWLRAAGPLGFAGIAAAFAACALLLGRRALEGRVTSNPCVSDRLGRLLQQLRAGDTLRGLTSCPGHAAFTVPGPSSPGEVTK